VQTQTDDLTPDMSKLRVQVQQQVLQQELERQSPDAGQRNLCFTMRSYYFHRQDGQAPVLVGTATCTPASKLQQKRVAPTPDGLFVPLGLQQQMENGQK
jgi:hypothetical protein